jgi:hypothetical protein
MIQSRLPVAWRPIDLPSICLAMFWASLEHGSGGYFLNVPLAFATGNNVG